MAGTKLGQRLPEGPQLRVPAHEPYAGPLLVAGTDQGADGERPDRFGLALHQERWQLGGPEDRLRPGHHLGRGQHLPRRGLDRHPRREVDGVALDRVGTPERGAEVAREHRPPADADLDRQRAGTVQHPPGDAQHPLLVVVRTPRRPGREHDLAAVAGEVGLEERHVVVRAGALDVEHHLVQGGRERVGPFRTQQLVGSREPHERHRDHPMLWLPDAGEHVCPDRGWQRAGRVDAGRLVRHADDVVEQRLRAQEPAAGQRGSEELRRQQRGGRGAEPDLAGCRRRLHVRGGGGVGSGDQQLTVDQGVAHQEEVEVSAVHPDGHAQHHGPRRRRDPADAPHGGPHPEHRPCGTQRVVGALEEQRHGISAPLDQVGAIGLGHVQQRREGGVEDVAHLLGADLALAGQAFGQPGEPRDVDEGEGSADAHVSVVRAGRGPREQQLRDVRNQPRDRRYRRVGHRRRRSNPLRDGGSLATERLRSDVVLRPYPIRRGSSRLCG